MNKNLYSIMLYNEDVSECVALVILSNSYYNAELKGNEELLKWNKYSNNKYTRCNVTWIDFSKLENDEVLFVGSN